MLILADENFPRRVVEYLRLANHDVAWAGNDFPGSSDRDVLERAESDGRILFTPDRDFWQIAVQRRERVKTCYAVGYRHSSGGTGQSRGNARIDPTHLQPPHTTRPRLNSGFRQGFLNFGSSAAGQGIADPSRCWSRNPFNFPERRILGASCDSTSPGWRYAHVARPRIPTSRENTPTAAQGGFGSASDERYGACWRGTRILMNLTPQRAELLLPFASQPQVLMETFFLCKIEQRSGVSIQAEAGVFYYPAARKLLKGLLNFETVQLAKRQYEGKLPELSHTLMSIVPAAEFDAVACVPSSAPEFLAPYRDAFRELNPSVVDLTVYLSRPPGTTSTDDLAPEIRLFATVFAPPADVAAGGRVLIIDDVLDTGVSAAAVAIAINRKWPAVSTFGLTCPAWIVHTR
jgi:hypothetical protein